MRDGRVGIFLLTLLLAVPAGCARHPAVDTGAVAHPAPIRLLPLAGPAANPDAEISAMCWCGDTLVLMPQHPERFGVADQPLGAFVLTRTEIESALDRPTTEVLTPRRVELRAPGLRESIPGWDGIEAVASRGNLVFMAVEARQNGRMVGVLLRGHAVHDGDGGLHLEMDTERNVPIAVPTDIANMSQEALVVCDDQVAVIFEANGINVHPGPHVALFGLDLAPRGTAPLEPVEYRVTDACRSDQAGRFWVINYFFPGERRALRPVAPPAGPVEHLVELQFHGDRVTRTDRAPLDLRVPSDGEARNWEALVRLPGRGFLVMTDRYPTTLLAHVPDPGVTP